MKGIALPFALGAGVLFLSGAAPPHAVDSKPLTTVRVGDSIDPLPLIGAIDKSYFAKQGTDVKLVRLGNAPAHIAALFGGSEDVFYGDTLAFASAVGNGLQIELFQPVNEGDAAPTDGQTTLLINPAASGIKRAADLEGKRIGVTPTPLITLLTKLWLRRNGVDPSSVTYVPINPQLAMGAALKTGHVEAISDGDPFTQQAQKDYGLIARGYQSRETPPGTTQAAFYSTTAWLRTHPELARHFAIAVRDGARRANKATPEEKAEVLAKFTPIDLHALENSIPGLVNQFHYYRRIDGSVNVEATQRWVDTAAKNGVIGKSIVVKRPSLRDGADGDAPTMTVATKLHVNGKTHVVASDPATPLLFVLLRRVPFTPRRLVAAASESSHKERL